MPSNSKHRTRIFPGLAPFLLAGIALLVSGCVFSSEPESTPSPAAKAASAVGPPAGERLAKLQAEADAMAKAEQRIAENIARARELQSRYVAVPSPTAIPSATPLPDALPALTPAPPAPPPTPAFALVPTPTTTPTPSPTSIPIRPDRWDLYENKRYGYTIRVAPGWVVNQFNLAAVSVKSPEGAATISVLYLGGTNPDVTAYSNLLLQTRKEESKVSFRMGKRSTLNALTHGIARMDYTRQTAEDKCVELGADLLVSNSEPGLQLFNVIGTVCEESAGQYWASLDALVDSFTLERYKAAGE